MVSKNTLLEIKSTNQLIYDEKKWKNISPNEWMKRISKLRELNRNKEADKILTIFKKKFPDYSPKR